MTQTNTYKNPIVSVIQSGFLFLILLLALGCDLALAQTFVIHQDSTKVGRTQVIRLEYSESLEEAGRRFGFGAMEMQAANPGIPSGQILAPGAKIKLPGQIQLPPKPHKGIIINRTTYRLFYFPADENVVYTYPVGIGRTGWETPKGKTRVVEKVSHPTWHPSKKLQKEAEKNGVFWPDEFPANEANPLGHYALRLGWDGILIHGTNAASSVGMKVSAGCIRMLPEDIEELYSRVMNGTEVWVY